MYGFAQDATRLRGPKRTTTDGLELEQRNWDAASSLALSELNIQPLGSKQQWGSDVRMVTSQWVLMNAPGTGDLDITVGDRIVYGGRTMDVVAEPERWPDFTGGIDHVEVTLQIAPPNAGAGGGSAAGQAVSGSAGAATAFGWTP